MTRIKRILRRLACAMFHGAHHAEEPWGIHHYYAHCEKCGRKWDASD